MALKYMVALGCVVGQGVTKDFRKLSRVKDTVHYPDCFKVA